MLKLWFIVTVFGKVVMSVGPIPDNDLDQCMTYRDARWEETQAFFRAGRTLPRVDGDKREITLDDITYQCHASERKPELGSTLPGQKQKPKEI